MGQAVGRTDQPLLRPARRDDAERVAWLLYMSSPAVYDRYAGGRERALRVIAGAFGKEGNRRARRW